jgi:predicted ester cyclase
MKLLFAIILFASVNACRSNLHEPGNSGMPERNKNLVKRAFNEMAAKQNYALVDSFFAVNIVDHGALEGQQQGLVGFKKAVSEFLGMFSRITIDIDDMVAERDIVSSRETWTLIRASDNKTLKAEVMHWFRIADGKITDEWSKGWESLAP